MLLGVNSLQVALALRRRAAADARLTCHRASRASGHELRRAVAAPRPLHQQRFREPTAATTPAAAAAPPAAFEQRVRLASDPTRWPAACGLCLIVGAAVAEVLGKLVLVLRVNLPVDVCV